MALNGTIVKRGNALGFEYRDRWQSEPKETRQVWLLASFRTRGYGACAATDAIGLAATCSAGRVSCYLGNGNHLEGEFANLGATQCVENETRDIARPKVKAGLELRWYNGAWQKLLKTGWKPA